MKDVLAEPFLISCGLAVGKGIYWLVVQYATSSKDIYSNPVGRKGQEFIVLLCPASFDLILSSLFFFTNKQIT